MSLPALLLFSGIYFAAVATPGPGIAALVARVLANGLQGAAPFILGYVIGDWIWLAFAATGLQLLAKQYAPLFDLVRYGGAAYLLFIALSLWRAKTEGAQIVGERDRRGGLQLFLSSLALTVGNPKVIVFFVSILPLVVDLDHLTAAAFIDVFIASALVLTLVLVGYALLANSARALFQSARSMRMLNRCAATVMAGAAVLIATR